MELREIKIDKDLWIRWQNGLMEDLEKLYADKGLDGIKELITTLETMEFEIRTKKDTANRYGRSKVQKEFADSRDVLITDPNFKFEERKPTEKQKKETKSAKVEKTVGMISADKLEALKARLAERMAKK